jgi:hypothetical protein
VVHAHLGVPHGVHVAEKVAQIIYEMKCDRLFEPPCVKGHISLQGTRKEVKVGWPDENNNINNTNDDKNQTLTIQMKEGEDGAYQQVTTIIALVQFSILVRACAL